MNDSDQNCPPATASVTVVASSSASSPAKETMLHPHQPANSVHSPLRTAVQSSATMRSSADPTASEIAGIWRGERELSSRLFFSFFLPSSPPPPSFDFFDLHLLLRLHLVPLQSSLALSFSLTRQPHILHQTCTQLSTSRPSDRG